MTPHDLWLEPEEDEEFIELAEPEGDYGGHEEVGDYGSDERERLISNRY